MVEDGIEVRGRMHYLRGRVPAEFQSVETRREVNVSLKTRCPAEARAKGSARWFVLIREWQAALAAQKRPDSREVFDAAMVLLQDMSVPYRRLA